MFSPIRIFREKTAEIFNRKYKHKKTALKFPKGRFYFLGLLNHAYFNAKSGFLAAAPLPRKFF
jgi:hypothetical protein